MTKTTRKASTVHHSLREERKANAAAKAVKAPEGWTVIAIGPFCWGRGPSGAAALRNAQKHLPRLAQTGTATRFMVYLATEDAYVDNLGRLCTKTAAGRAEDAGQYTRRSTTR